ncbi:MAG: 50S ribosome-binding GTPase [Nanoarchaeota archaeon]|nr:50S ribosome-binding GTPase [Nanoarchaeota archaeon]
MRPRYSFSSRRNRRIDKMTKQRQKYPDIAKKIVDTSDIILEVLDSRFPNQTRNKELESEIKTQKKKIIYVLNKSDLAKNQKRTLPTPNVKVSCTKRIGIKQLRDKIKQISKTIEQRETRELRKDKVVKGEDSRIKVGVIGYPNTGKSSLLNLLSGKKAAGVGSEAGFTKGVQKIRLSSEIVLIDTPGVIPEEDYSQTEKKKIAQNTMFGGKSYTQIKEPEIVIHRILEEFPNSLEKHYKIKLENNLDSEELIEKVGNLKGFFKKGNKVDEDKTAREILRAWQKGEINI